MAPLTTPSPTLRPKYSETGFSIIYTLNDLDTSALMFEFVEKDQTEEQRSTAVPKINQICMSI